MSSYGNHHNPRNMYIYIHIYIHIYIYTYWSNKHPVNTSNLTSKWMNVFFVTKEDAFGSNFLGIDLYWPTVWFQHWVKPEDNHWWFCTFLRFHWNTEKPLNFGSSLILTLTHFPRRIRFYSKTYLKSLRLQIYLLSVHALFQW